MKAIERLDVEALHERKEQDEALQILDVRERSEWESGHIPDSHSLPYHDIEALPKAIDTQHPIAAICGSGERSGVAASLLQRHGAEHVIHVVDGGVGTWSKRGWPLKRPQQLAAG